MIEENDNFDRNVSKVFGALSIVLGILLILILLPVFSVETRIALSCIAALIAPALWGYYSSNWIRFLQWNIVYLRGHWGFL